ncbi:CgeB family protein [Methylobacterium sp. ID0610]|uniref:CgeB family protein n=1 Tax=Methylobacterium carpenticola TaxID=3344827 RepID=UPI0036B2C571
MRLVVFGLTVSSSWGNGHATLWRGLCRALAAAGHHVAFFERDVPYYAENRDLHALPGGDLVLYPDWTPEVEARAARAVRKSDAVIVTSYCPDALAATRLAQSARLRVFYDLDTPVTLARLAAGEAVPYLGPRGLRDFDLVLSYTGGGALDALRTRLGAERVLPLYGHVDPDAHRPTRPAPHYASDLSYLGTYAADRQAGVERLLVEPARRRPSQRFLIGGAQYPADFPWARNIFFVRHLPPAEHPAFFSSSRFTLNVTREAMAAMGWCPSGRLFEAAACGTPLITDAWEGLDAFFTPGREIVVAQTTAEAVAALDMDEGARRALAAAARARTLDEHSSARRAATLIAALEETPAPAGALPAEA